MGAGPFSSDSRTSYTATNTAQNTGFSETGQAQSVNVNLTGKYKTKGGDITVQLTDQGAINAALTVADKSLRGVEQFGNNVTSLVEGITAAIRGQGEDLIAAVAGANKQAIGAVQEANRSDLENIGLAAIKWGTLALAAYLAARAVWSMAK